MRTRNGEKIRMKFLTIEPPNHLSCGFGLKMSSKNFRLILLKIHAFFKAFRSLPPSPLLSPTPPLISFSRFFLLFVSSPPFFFTCFSINQRQREVRPRTLVNFFLFYLSFSFFFMFITTANIWVGEQTNCLFVCWL